MNILYFSWLLRTCWYISIYLSVTAHTKVHDGLEAVILMLFWCTWNLKNSSILDILNVLCNPGI